MMRRILVSIFFIWILILLQPLQAGVDPIELKAVMIQRIATFIEWTDCNRDSITIALYNDSDDVDRFKKVLVSQKINGRTITIKDYKNLNDLVDVSSCDILYLGDISSTTRTKILERLSKKSVLIIGNTRDDSTSGVSTVLLKDGNRYRILINPSALKTANIKADYRLLKLAEIVEGS